MDQLTALVLMKRADALHAALQRDLLVLEIAAAAIPADNVAYGVVRARVREVDALLASIRRESA